ncbi:hypothetical protein BCR41DRAFT_376070 [Lobosporangium transversale]|uniref:DUF6589 domain-containing protein n=1 Tax=Lobosporangium transversale TaxID=64571 RepID=A0A1Y2G654_9FUNG|nr:hypothetical protein BCR41DRAFT_376070 [Lobosporangium transversale]ORY92980.1 hypothetical protein BCR41DRAFT_376070 [Lobosporangium transversale]|eukprot:XP_021875137.1 hypothetical protein BCR41DRAFT_376070 [Lobosporangium transversale]
MTRYTSSHCNLYQKVMGTYLFSNGASRKTMEALSHAGLSVSYSTVMRILRQLTVNALADVRAVAANKSWYIVYDNLNFRRVKHDQRLDNRDYFVSGTTATLIQCDPTNGAFNQGSYERLCFKDLIISRDNDAHFQEVATYHLINVLKRHYEAFKSLQNDAPVKNLLPAKKSETFPLPSMDINESTTEGNKDVINTVINNTLQLPREWFNSKRHIVVAGDQLTIKNIRSLLKYRRDH